MVNKVDIWKDAPEGTEFIVEYTYNDLMYYKTNSEGVLLFYLRDGWWDVSCYDNINELVKCVTTVTKVYPKLI